MNEPKVCFLDMEGRSDKGDSYDIKVGGRAGLPCLCAAHAATEPRPLPWRRPLGPWAHSPVATFRGTTLATFRATRHIWHAMVRFSAARVQLVTPMLLIAKVVILNVVCPTRPEKESILKTINVMIMAARQIHDQVSEGASGRAVAPFGHLHVVLRDAYRPKDQRELKEKECHAVIFDEEAVKSSMSKDEQRAIQERNRIRKELVDAFESAPRTWCLPKLRDEPEPYYRDNVDPEDRYQSPDDSYRARIDAMRSTIGGQLREAKLFDGKPLTGRSIVTLMPLLTEALSIDNPAISPPSMWQAVIAQGWRECESEVKRMMHKCFEQLEPQLPKPPQEIQEVIVKVRRSDPNARRRVCAPIPAARAEAEAVRREREARRLPGALLRSPTPPRLRLANTRLQRRHCGVLTRPSCAAPLPRHADAAVLRGARTAP